MTTLAIIQSCYIPWKGYFDLIRRADRFIMYDCVQYTDRDWRNRNRIKTSEGLQWLTIPVHANRQSLISEVTCAGDQWRTQHLNAIRHAYAKAPYFSQYADALEEIYHSPATRLSDINREFLQLLCGFADIRTPVDMLGAHILPQGDKTDRLLAVCAHYGATRYLSGPAAKSYLDMDKFAASGIEVQWMQYDHYPEYPQFHPPFEHSVSMLDLLFHTGAEWHRYL